MKNRPDCFNTEAKARLEACDDCDVYDLCDTQTDELDLCPQCNGSGEGMYDGTRCSRCHGSGCAGHTDSSGRDDPPDWWFEEQADRMREMRHG